MSLAAASLLPAIHGQRTSIRTAAQQSNQDTRAGKLLWSDEFNGPNGSAPDPSKWVVVYNDSGFGNNELEYYTHRAANLHEADGHLVLTARKETFTGKDGQTRSYTSGRIESRGRFDAKYGRIEARIKLPKGKGLWPAFWLLGSDFKTTGWPGCGEIDIMENVGFEPSIVHGSLHGPGYSGATPLGGLYALPGKAAFSDAYHVFAVDWQPGEIRFYVDNHLYETRKESDLEPGQRWVFDHPFYIVLNLAVGGYWPGNPDASTEFPARMLVDYVRVYSLDHTSHTDTSSSKTSLTAAR